MLTTLELKLKKKKKKKFSAPGWLSQKNMRLLILGSWDGYRPTLGEEITSINKLLKRYTTLLEGTLILFIEMLNAYTHWQSHSTDTNLPYTMFTKDVCKMIHVPLFIMKTRNNLNSHQRWFLYLVSIEHYAGIKNNGLYLYTQLQKISNI